MPIAEMPYIPRRSWVTAPESSQAGCSQQRCGNLSCKEWFQQIDAITSVRDESVIVIIGVSVRAPNMGNRGDRTA
jgi:hypothetical protein